MLENKRGGLFQCPSYTEAMCDLIYSHWDEITGADYGDVIELNQNWAVNIHSEEGLPDLMWLGLDGDDWESAAAILYEEVGDGIKIILEIL